MRPALIAPRAEGPVEAGPGWDAVGVVRIGAGGTCSGALIRDDLVLTAAHCLFAEDGSRAEGLRFLAGWRDERAVAKAEVADAIASPGYDPLGVSSDNLPHDVALLRLATPIRDRRITPLALGDLPKEGDRVAVVSYASGRMARPSLEADCGIVEARGAALVTDCLAAPGASGSPMLKLGGRRPTVVSIVSGGSTVEGREYTVAAGLGTRVAELTEALEARRAPFERHGARGSGGAKFVRP